MEQNYGSFGVQTGKAYCSTFANESVIQSMGDHKNNWEDDCYMWFSWKLEVRNCGFGHSIQTTAAGKVRNKRGKTVDKQVMVLITTNQY